MRGGVGNERRILYVEQRVFGKKENTSLCGNELRSDGRHGQVKMGERENRKEKKTGKQVRDSTDYNRIEWGNQNWETRSSWDSRECAVRVRSHCGD